jgi:type VI secretion system protein ImpE
MTAKDLLDQSRLTDAIEQQDKDVAARPDELAARIFLLELLCFAGGLDRAEHELEAIERLDPRPECTLGAKVYRSLLQAERRRTRAFAGGEVPRFFSATTTEVALHLEALELVAKGCTVEARASLDRAVALGRSRRGLAGGTAFERIRDADDLLGPVLEVITADGYYWVPWDDVQLLLVPPPQFLRDLFWAPARLATADGLLGEVYLPNLYPGSHQHPDEAARLGHVTVWSDAGSGVARGAGQKLFLVDDEPRTLLEIAEVQFPSDTAVDTNSE